MTTLTIYSKTNCQYCDQAKALLAKKEVPYLEVMIDLDVDSKAFLAEKGLRSVPQFFFGRDLAFEGGYNGLLQQPESFFDKLRG